MKYLSLFSAITFLFCSIISEGQSWGPQQLISSPLAGPADIAIGDIDQDGDPDVVVTSIDDSRVSWYERNGSGYNSQQNITDMILRVDNLELCDIDGDEDLDIIVDGELNTTELIPNVTRTVYKIENLGGGEFASPEVIAHVQDIASMVVGDVDDNGSCDIIIAYFEDIFAADGLLWLSNNGAGVFGAAEVVSESFDALTDMTTIDVDSDGDLDLLTTSTGDGFIKLFKNNGLTGFDGSFTLVSSEIPDPTRVHSGDLDSDGNEDVVSYDETGMYIFKGTATSVSSAAINLIAPDDFMVDFWLVDLDGDEDLDILAEVNDFSRLRWYENTSSGGLMSFSAPTSLGILISSGIDAMEIGDLEGDGDLDLVFASSIPGSISIPSVDQLIYWENSGPALFENGYVLDESNIQSPKGVLTADLSGNGIPDLVTISSQAGIRIFRNFGGSFTFDPYIIGDASANYTSIDIGDLDGDGDNDIVGITGGNEYLFRNEGDFNFTTVVLIEDIFSTSWAIALVDTDGDDDLDLVTSYESPFGSTQYWRENDGTGNFIDDVIFDNIDPGYNFIIDEDIDADGDIDLVTGIVSDFGFAGNIYYYENEGLGAYTPRELIDVNVRSNSIQFVDLDGDNDLDLLGIADEGLGSDPQLVAKWYENDGSGDFTSLGEVGVHIIDESYFSNQYSVHASDFNGDGISDLSVGTAHRIFGYIGDAEGNFSARHTVTEKILGVGTTYHIDLDNDGKPDLLSTSSADDKVAWYKNLGAGCPEDINGDGHVDIADFIQFNSAYNTWCDSCPEDINEDSFVDIEDFIQFNSAFGTDCE